MGQWILVVTILVSQGYGSSQTVEKPLKQTSDTILSSEQESCNSSWRGDTPDFVWVIIGLFYIATVVMIVILLVVIREQHKIILRQNRSDARLRDSSRLSYVTEDPHPIGAISLKPVSFPTKQTNDIYEQIPEDNSTAPHGEIDSNTAFSYYNTVVDPPDIDTAVQQSSERRDRPELNASHGVGSTHYQELVLSEPSNGQGDYQELCLVTKGPGNYASLECSAVQEYQGLTTSVPSDQNEKI